MNKKCEITPNNRNCRWCRYQKCLRVGMTIEGAKLGRKPNIVKKTLIDANTSKKRAYCDAEDNDSNNFVDVVDDHDSAEEARTSKRAKFDYSGSVETSLNSDSSFKNASFSLPETNTGQTSDSNQQIDYLSYYQRPNLADVSAYQSFNGRPSSSHSNASFPQNDYIAYAYNYLNSGSYAYSSYLPSSSFNYNYLHPASRSNQHNLSSSTSSTCSHYNYQ
jgi:hypothetical protein